MNNEKNTVRPLVRELAHELSVEDLASIGGGQKCEPTGYASGTANWDGGADDGIHF